jgi:hypothetical protein
VGEGYKSDSTPAGGDQDSNTDQALLHRNVPDKKNVQARRLSLRRRLKHESDVASRDSKRDMG